MNTHQRHIAATVDPVRLDRLAEVAVKVGLQLRPGQDLFLTAPIVALPLVRRIAEHAYKAGAGLVTPLFSDEDITLARYRHAADASFDRAPIRAIPDPGYSSASKLLATLHGRPRGDLGTTGSGNRTSFIPSSVSSDRLLRASNRMSAEGCLEDGRGWRKFKMGRCRSEAD